MSFRPNYPDPALVPTSPAALNALACLHIISSEEELSYLTDFLAKEVHNHLMKIKGWTVAGETIVNPQGNYGYHVVAVFCKYFEIVSSSIAGAAGY